MWISKPLTNRWQWVKNPTTAHGDCGLNISTFYTSNNDPWIYTGALTPGGGSYIGLIVNALV